MALFVSLIGESWVTIRDLIPIALLFGIFQFGVVREAVADLQRLLVGLMYIVVGLTLFRIGLGATLVPIGADMAVQLTRMAADSERAASTAAYLPLIAFAACIGFTASLIEPTVIAIADRVRDLSGGALRPWSLRIAIAAGVAAGLSIGTLRIITDTPLALVLAVLIAVLAVLALTAPKTIVPLALDSGGMATSALTVPLITAFGVATAETLPGRSALEDGFGLIMLALLGPAIALLLFARVYALYENRNKSGDNDAV